MGLRKVHAQAAPRGGEEGRLPLRRVVQADHGLSVSQPPPPPPGWSPTPPTPPIPPPPAPPRRRDAFADFRGRRWWELVLIFLPITLIPIGGLLGGATRRAAPALDPCNAQKSCETPLPLLVLTQVTSTQVKRRSSASLLATVLKALVTDLMNVGSPNCVAAGTTDQLGIEMAATRPSASASPRMRS